MTGCINLGVEDVPGRWERVLIAAACNQSFIRKKLLLQHRISMFLDGATIQTGQLESLRQFVDWLEQLQHRWVTVHTVLFLLNYSRRLGPAEHT